ncbi:M48 family metallopeptidase [Selenomonas ruminantium]|uniref:M48 family metallopeptidase n=1 Tax=Selenomonas ruminantium TaxID=971 RepID=UPI0026F0C2B8|nr:M48 family metallopeptidase [Selenomonas ruminantium]
MEYMDTFFHPLFAEKLSKLQEIIPCPDAVLDCYKEYDGKIKKPDLLGKTVQVTELQFPELYKRIKQMAETAGCKIPKIFLYEDFYYGMEAKGATNPRIEISTKTLADLPEKSFDFLVAREIFRIKYDVVKWTAVSEQLIRMMTDCTKIPGIDLFNDSFQMTYSAWSRCAHYSADCFAYETIKDIQISIRTVLTLIMNNIDLAEHVNIPAYIAQMKDIYLLDDVVSRYTENDEKIPYGPLRIRTLLSYASVGRM